MKKLITVALFLSIAISSLMAQDSISAIKTDLNFNTVISEKDFNKGAIFSPLQLLQPQN